eukprot:6077098-Amphidinium_carterae.1
MLSKARLPPAPYQQADQAVNLGTAEHPLFVPLAQWTWSSLVTKVQHYAEGKTRPMAHGVWQPAPDKIIAAPPGELEVCYPEAPFQGIRGQSGTRHSSNAQAARLGCHRQARMVLA